ncbi:nitrite reductase small subunit NirD [Hahella ganghwensis]|uniref:nitrite reductase small subunit NirD n=1 Tax=Hahella ganghwensis TaxID=286420 RepID=UPI00036C307B|nr:nitrite reductase small subunit NirD [Hahella ganghwensis]
MTQWIDIGLLEDIPKLGARVVGSVHGDIAIFRTKEDKVFALRDKCPHKGGALSQGIVHGNQVTCPLHNWVISLLDGEAQGFDSGCTPAYPTKLENNRIYLSLEQERQTG